MAQSASLLRGIRPFVVFLVIEAVNSLPLTPTSTAVRLNSPAQKTHSAPRNQLAREQGFQPLRGGESAAAGSRGLYLGPTALVTSFTICNLLNYVDRGLVNGVLPTLGEDFHVSKTHLGALTGAFMGGYCALCPIFAYLSNKVSPFLLMGLGLSVWEVSAVMAATAPTFQSLAAISTVYHSQQTSAQWLLAARLLSGVGEASFQAIAPPFLDDAATEDNKGSLLAIFFCAIPVGTALGYVFGGYMETAYSWREGFLVLAALMMPLTVASFFVTNRIQVKQDTTKLSSEGGKEPGLKELFTNKVWLAATLGYSAWTFTIGAFAVWGPSLLHSVHRLPLAEADMKFGAITVAMGLLGTAAGGMLLDRISKGPAHTQDNTNTKNINKKDSAGWLRRGEKNTQPAKKEEQAGGRGIVTSSLVLCSTLTALAMPFLFLAFAQPPGTSLSVFYLGMVIGEFLLFATTAPLNGVFLWCVSSAERSMSLAVANLVIHLLGDVLSPVVAGWLWQRTGSGQTAMMVVSAWLGWGVLLWALGAAISSRT